MLDLGHTVLPGYRVNGCGLPRWASAGVGHMRVQWYNNYSIVLFEKNAPDNLDTLGLER